MGPEAEAVLDGADTVLVERPLLVRDRWQVEIRLLVRVELPALEVADTLREDARVARGEDVPADRERQPEIVV